MAQASGKFQIILISPTGTMLGGPVYSVIIPAHDGLRGILYNHLPMFCALGLGIMEVRKEEEELKEVQKPSYFLIDGGFALVASNLLKIVAYDAVCLEGLSDEQIEQLKQKFHKRLVRKDISKAELEKETRRAKFLDQLIELNKVS